MVTWKGYVITLGNHMLNWACGWQNTAENKRVTWFWTVYGALLAHTSGKPLKGRYTAPDALKVWDWTSLVIDGARTLRSVFTDVDTVHLCWLWVNCIFKCSNLSKCYGGLYVNDFIDVINWLRPAGLRLLSAGCCIAYVILTESASHHVQLTNVRWWVALPECLWLHRCDSQ